MPFPPLLEALQTPTRRRVLRADTGLPARGTVKAAVREGFLARTAEEELYVESGRSGRTGVGADRGRPWDGRGQSCRGRPRSALGQCGPRRQGRPRSAPTGTPPLSAT